MSAQPVPSDLEIAEASSDELGYGWSLLIDLRGEFQGSALAFSGLAFIVPILCVLSVVFEWVDRSELVQLGIGGAATVACIAVAVHSWIWFFWCRRRLRAVDERMRKNRD